MSLDGGRTGSFFLPPQNWRVAVIGFVAAPGH
jgi:hypothetical protein